MERTQRIIWRSSDSGKELLAVEQGKFIVPAYSLSKLELMELAQAIEECLEELPQPAGNPSNN